jgi:hypothetical protein
MKVLLTVGILAAAALVALSPGEVSGQSRCIPYADLPHEQKDLENCEWYRNEGMVFFNSPSLEPYSPFPRTWGIFPVFFDRARLSRSAFADASRPAFFVCVFCNSLL